MEHIGGVAAPFKPSLPARALRFVRHRLRKPYKRIRGATPLVRLLNRRSRALFNEHEAALTLLGQRILDDLNRDGISITDVQALFPSSTYLKDLQVYAEKLLHRSSPGRKKTFLKYLWGENIEKLDLDNPFNHLAIEPLVLEIINSYMGLFAHFFFSSGNVTVPGTRDAAAAGSQRWHRDPGSGDKRIVKIFLYINDVPPEAGPFEYVRKSSTTGAFAGIFPFVQPDGVYPESGAVDAHPLLREHILSNVGKAGTMIFCDTTGLHRGGFSTGKERIMATAAYTSPGSIQGFRFKLTPETKAGLQDLPSVSKYALGIER